MHLNQCYLWCSTANIPRGDFREETQRKPLPKIAKNRAELEFGQVMASQNYGASTSLINCGNVQKWSTRSLNRGKIMGIQVFPSSWWPKPRRDEPDGSVIPRSSKKKIRDRPTAKKAVKFNIWRVKNPDLNKIKRKFLRRQESSFYFGASTVRTTLNSTLI